MQDAIKSLTEFWTSHGCMSTQPFNTEVGAGTMNPATLLRVLGPEPWNVAYPEPSVRPDDSRYGENPNRLQQHTQFQVILKPDPGNPQELYLKSLEALGIDLHAHDVRFVEDNWAQPAIGAWGLGWEVWLDGMEITQFTYFQQVGGQTLDPVSVELTYGLERILMSLQGVTHFKDITYAPGITYGEVFGQNEFEMSSYYLDEADVATNQALYDAYIAEAERLIEARLPIPAHTYVLKSSHAFNVLDTRGAISTTERATAFGTMRKLSRELSALWIERREELGHPLLAATNDRDAANGTADTSAAADVSPADLGEAAQTFVCEIGVEELPPHVVTATIESVKAGFSDKLKKTGLTFGDITVQGTPRRIVTTITDLAAREPDQDIQKKGPKWSAGFDDSGEPTRALAGFLKGQQASVDDVVKQKFGKHDHVCLNVSQPGRDVLTVMAEIVTDVVSGLRSDKNMKWSDPNLQFSRAIRWVVSLWGSHIVPAQISELTAGRTTRVHRLAEVPEVTLATATDLAKTHADAGLIVDETARRESIVTQAQKLAEEVGGVVDIAAEADLLDEITNLVEEPVGVCGTFDAKYLELPEKILTSVMAKHQRYLPVRAQDGSLLPFFITMANGRCDTTVVAGGNESVLRARYEDALFFYQADQKVELSTFKTGLEKLTFENRVGSMAQRADRIADVATSLAAAAGVDPQEPTLKRAGELALFDLSTQMVIEMSSLAGEMARDYAQRAGESTDVAEALFEMELPRTSTDDLPESSPGALLAVAARADALMAMFAVGAKPTGSSDPFALRRAALGLSRILRDVPALQSLTIPDTLHAAAERLRSQGLDVAAEAIDSAIEFSAGRFEQLLRDEGVSAELIAVVKSGMNHPADVATQIADVEQAASVAGFAEAVAVLLRISRIVPADTIAVVNAGALTEPVEKTLLTELRTAQSVAPFTSLAHFVESSGALVTAVNEFFEDVLVMAEDPAVREARLGVLQTVANLVPGSFDVKALDIWLSTRS